MKILCFGQKMGMDINQIVELWRSLSPRLARAVPVKELLKGEYDDEEKSDEDSEDKTPAHVAGHHEKEDD
jgi:hypothetical protein